MGCQTRRSQSSGSGCSSRKARHSSRAGAGREHEWRKRVARLAQEGCAASAIEQCLSEAAHSDPLVHCRETARFQKRVSGEPSGEGH